MGGEEAAGPARHVMIRPPVGAGSFYPAGPSDLAQTVDALITGVATVAERTPTAIVVPHAGYVYSGPVAASAYVLVPNTVRRVAVLGPAHFVPLRGLAVPRTDRWTTPLGEIDVDPGLRDIAVDGGAQVDDRPHAPEHAIEVQLPFLIRILDPGFEVLPVAVGAEEPGRVADLLEALRNQADLTVVSTDLSHYLDDQAAKATDRKTADAVVARDARALGPAAACGIFALRGLVELARRHALPVELLDLRTSADTAGHPERVVGYAAFAVM